MPRDPRRINRVLHLLGELWKHYPDQRLGQMLRNYVFLMDLDTMRNRSLTFDLEDDVLIARLEKAIAYAAAHASDARDPSST